MKKKKYPKIEKIDNHGLNSRTLDTDLPERSADEVWDRLMKIGEELGKGWQSKKSAVEILSEMRR